MASGDVHLHSENPDTATKSFCSNVNVDIEESVLKTNDSEGSCSKDDDNGSSKNVLIAHEQASLEFSALENDSTASSSNKSNDVPVLQNVRVNGVKSSSADKTGSNIKSHPIQVHAKGWSLSAHNQVPIEKQPSNSSYSYSAKYGKFQHGSPKSYQRVSSSKNYSAEAPNACQPPPGTSGVNTIGHVPGNGEHVVLLHVNPGETISFFMGDHTQLIQGPATVRMVSCNSTPPMPLPVQVPPGHMVQQIVDENGTLRHIILSPQPPIAVPVGSPYSAGSTSVSTSSGSNTGPSPFFVYPHHSYPPPMQYHTHLQPGMTNQNLHNHGGHMQHTISSNSQSTGSQGQYSSMNSQASMNKDERTQKQFFKLKKRLEARQKDSPINRLEHLSRNAESTAGAETESSLLEQDSDQSKTYEYLSAIRKPNVSGVTARSALVTWSAPPSLEDSSEKHSDIVPESILYYIFISDKGPDSAKKVVYFGNQLECQLNDLKPGTIYNICLQATLDEHCGKLSEYISFRTLACKPEQPQPPKLLSRTKTSIFLKWNAAVDSGSRILSYVLESDEGVDGNNFTEVFDGLQKQFKAVKLKTATCYRFRLAAVNEFGKSLYSDVVCFSTTGSAPSQPPPPELVQARSNSLTLKWEARPNDDSFTLQMEEEGSLLGFLPVFNGKETSYTCSGLKRNSFHKFRLSANNDEGSSPWSQSVCFSTLPEKPSSPSRPYLKGKVQSTCFKVTWDSPKDDGGTDITGYTLEMDSGNGFEVVYSGTDLEHQLENLEPAKMHFLHVCCRSEGGSSPFSEPCAIQTSPVVPGKCQPPRLAKKPEANTIGVKWAYPDYDGGSEVFKFEVSLEYEGDTKQVVYEGTEPYCVAASLCPGRQYAFFVRAFNRVGPGPWSDPLEVTTGAGTPDVPKEVQLVPRSPHSVFVSWVEPPSNGAAIIEYRLEICQTEYFQPVYVGPNLSAEVKNLIPATSYLFRLQAVNSAGASPFSESARCQTPPSSPASIPLSNIKITSESSTISLSWKEPNDHGAAITSYNVEVVDTVSTSVEELEICVESLSPETTYRIRIQAVNNIGLGPFTSFKVKTRGLPPNPPILECCGYTHNSLRLKWGDGKNPEFIQYTLEMQNISTGCFVPIFQGTGQNFKVSRLEEVTDYSFRIFATNNEGDGPYSDVFVFTTPKALPPSPKPPKVSLITENSCYVEWLPTKSIGDDMVSYKLQISSKASDYTNVAYDGIIQTGFVVRGLQPSTEYAVKVAAVRHCSDNSGDLCSPYSPSTVFCTVSSVIPTSPTKTISVISSLTDREPLTDQQWAIIILCGFTIFAIFVAMLIHWILS